MVLCKFRNWLEAVENSKCYYFGTFDPIHNDHVKIAQSVAAHGHIIIFVPAAESPDKIGKKTAPHIDRVNMCKLIANKYGWEVNDIENQLSKPNRSINTLRALEPEFDTKPGKTPFVLGADNLSSFHTWHGADQLSKKLSVYAIGRGGHSLDSMMPGMDIKKIESKTQDLSSTMIRLKVAEGIPIEQFVDPDVAQYIQEKGLYLGA